jgi:hypothetical protein
MPCGRSCGCGAPCCAARLAAVDVHPLDEQLVVVASLDRSVRLFDLRPLRLPLARGSRAAAAALRSDSGSSSAAAAGVGGGVDASAVRLKPLQSLSFSQSVNGARFSPGDGAELLVTAMDHRLHLYQLSPLPQLSPPSPAGRAGETGAAKLSKGVAARAGSGGSAEGREGDEGTAPSAVRLLLPTARRISHNNHTGRWLTKFTAAWVRPGGGRADGRAGGRAGGREGRPADGRMDGRPGGRAAGQMTVQVPAGRLSVR